MTAEKQSLISYLRAMHDFDEGISNLSFEEFGEIVNVLSKEKVDACYHFLKEIEARVGVVDSKIKELQETKASLKKSLDNYRKYLDYAMGSTDTKKMPGEYYTLYRTEKKTLNIVDFDLSSQHYIEFNSMADGVVDRKYTLNKTKFKGLLKDNPELRKEFATEEKSSSVSFRTNKGVK